MDEKTIRERIQALEKEISIARGNLQGLQNKEEQLGNAIVSRQGAIIELKNFLPKESGPGGKTHRRGNKKEKEGS